MSTPRLAVWMYGILAAQIDERRGGSLRLRYTKEAIERWPINTALISCSLPVARSWRPATNYFRGLLPEGQHLQAAASAANVTTADTYGLLVRYGRDVAGALIITRHDEEPDEARWGAEVYTEDSLDDAIENLAGDNPIVPDDSELSLPGLQNKILLVREHDAWARPTGGRPSTHILKIDDARYPGLIEAEHAALQLAYDIGLAQSAPQLETINGRACLIVERYDRTLINGTVGRIHQEDTCQALGINHEANRGRAKYEAAGGPSYLQAARLLDDHTNKPDQQIAQLAKFMTYTRIIGNADAHGKNLAVLHDQAGHTKLAPIYDTVPTALWPNLRTQPAMKIGNAASLATVTRTDLAAETGRWPGTDKVRQAAIDETVDVISNATIDHDPLAKLVDSSMKALQGR